jgi:hypothetical protein
MKNSKLTLMIVIMLATTYACSTGSEANQPVANQEPNPPEQEPAAQNTLPADSQDNLAAETAEETSSQPGLGESFLPAINLPEIELFTATENAGLKPLFEWAAVEGAAWYALVVKNAEGQTYWAWMGPENSIYLGGTTTQPGDDRAGPRLEPGMSWAVIAYDSEDSLIAASSLRPISP